jgi:glutamyl-tRNA synthetase
MEKVPTARGRFAPSPTGDLHVGNLRTALLAFLQIRALGGVFVLRVEDLDPERSLPGVAEQQCDALRALGIEWDEGPGVGGPHAPYFQSQRGDLYREALIRLEGLGLTYPCYCSRADVARAARSEAGDEAGEDGPRYPGTCRDLTPQQRGEREAKGFRASLRFRVPPGTTAFEDRLLGPIAQDVERTVGDWVLRRADGTATYQLAVVVDDLAMGITHVLRGSDLVSSTPRQILLYQALGAAPPLYFHVPILLGPDGAKLSKHHGPVGFSALQAAGVAPSQLLAELARLSGQSVAATLASAIDLLPSFSLDRLPRNDLRWSPEALLKPPQPRVT